MARHSVDLSPYRLPSRAEYVNAAEIAKQAPLLSFSMFESYLQMSKQVVQMISPNATFRLINDHYVGDNGVSHVNFRQTIDGIDVDNADFNVNVSSKISPCQMFILI